MDLPTCPSCGQSVIDDDAVECPFCGASMKGGGGGATGKPPTRRKPAPKPASGPASKAAAEKPKPEEDDPFALESKSLAKAVPATPKPGKGRLHKVVCPMCETAGFIPKKAAGREVRCANPDCLVPVFTAPALEKPKEEPQAVPEATPGASRGMIVGGGIAAVALIGFGAWWFLFRSPPDDEISFEVTPIAGTDDTEDLDGSNDNDQSSTDATDATDSADSNKVALDEIQLKAIKRMVVESRISDRNRSKPFCRQLDSEAWAYRGDVEQARAELSQLQVVGRQLDWYGIRPLTVLAWNELKAGNKDQAVAYVDESVQLSSKLPRFGRTPIDMATDLAAILAAVGRADEARKLLASKRSNEAGDTVLSAILHVRRAYEAAGVPRPPLKPLIPWRAPQMTAVAVDLALHGFVDEARQWARQAGEPAIQAEGLVAVTEAVAQARGEAAAQALLDSTELDELPIFKARLLAAVAHVEAESGRNEQAEAQLAKATQLVDAVESTPFVVPDLRGLYDLELPNILRSEMVAVAATEIARVHAALGQSTEALEWVRRAMSFARAAGPTTPRADRLVAEADPGNRALQNGLRQILNLSSDQQVRTAFRNYRRKIMELKQSADRRFELQQKLIEQASEWGIHEGLWEMVKERSQANSIDERVPLVNTPIPWFLATAFQASGNAAGAREILQALQQIGNPDFPLERLILDVRAEIRRKAYTRAGQRVEGMKSIDEGARIELLLDEAENLVVAGNLDGAMALVDGVKNPLWREILLDQVASLETRRGGAREVWARSPADNQWAPTERVAWLRGLAVGISVVAKPEEPATN